MPPLLRKPPRTPIRLSSLLHHPLTDLLIMVLIVTSVLLLVLEVSVEPNEGSWLLLVSDLITWLFVVELAARYTVAKKKSRFFRRYWPDILAVLPLLRPLRIFRFFRLLRLFRLFQLGLLLDRRVAMLRGVLRMNFYFLWVLLVITAIFVVGGAVMVFIVEQPTGGDFLTLRESIWWATYAIIAGEPIGTMPSTGMGRTLLVALMLAGMGLFAVFTGLVSATMIDRLKGMSQVSNMDIDELENHLVLCGWNQGARPLLAELTIDPRFEGKAFVLVNERDRPPNLQDVGVRPELIHHLRGDFTQLDVLRKAGIERAGRAVVLADDTPGHQRGDRDARSVLAALTIERMHPSIYCVVELMDPANKDHLAVAGVEAVIMRNDLSGRALASACRHPRLASVMMDLLTSRAGARLERIPGPVAPMSYGELLQRCKAEVGSTVLGVETADGELFINPDADHRVGEKDYLVVVQGQAHMVSGPGASPNE